MRRKGLGILSTLVALLVIGPIPARLFAQATPEKQVPTPTYTHDAYGLEKEFEPFLNAYMASDPAIDKTLSSFAVPDAGSWFAIHFPPEKAHQLADDQKAAIAKYQQSLTTRMSSWPSGTHFQVSCSKHLSGPGEVHPRPGAIVPTLDFESEQWDMIFIAETNSSVGTTERTFSSLGNFVYLDGAFRFLGSGPYPFWSAPEVTVAPSATPAQLISPAAQAAYDDSSSGLRHLIQDALKLVKEKNQAKLDALTASMVIPDPDAWFSAVFGTVTGRVYARSYIQHRAALPDELSRFFQSLVTQQFTSVDVTRFTNACVIEADENDYPVLASRQRPDALSEVVFSHANSSQSFRYFSYIDGGFRFLQNLEPNPSPPLPAVSVASTASSAASIAAPMRVKVSGELLRNHLIKEVEPPTPKEPGNYPPLSQDREGRVVLHVLVSPEGAPTEIAVVRGRCSLARSATEAVRQWRYSPTLVNGVPVEVESNIALDFVVRLR